MIDIKVIYEAKQKKPKFASACNNCGWCCMTEVCAIGRELGGGVSGPCKKLKKVDGKFLCSLAEVPQIREQLAMGEGCDAKTQDEIIKELMQ